MSETTTAPLVVLPFEDLSRDDQINHLLTLHNEVAENKQIEA